MKAAPAALALALAAAAPARANPADVYGFGARGQAMAGAQVAGADDTSAAYYNPALLAASPDIRIDVDFNDRRVNLIEEGMDLALRITDHLPDTTVARRLTACRFAVVASPEYLRRHGTPRHPDELTRHACLAYSLAARGSWVFLVDGQPFMASRAQQMS